MKLLEDLKQKFPMKEVPPYGFCIVVPGAEFDPDNEANLFDQGYKCFYTFIDGKPVTLVRVVKAEKGSGEKTVYSPTSTASTAPITAKASAEAEGQKETLSPRSSPPSSKWRPEEDEVLVKLWNERVLIEKMTPSFPGRTEAAIRLRIQRLERYGRITKRAGRPKTPLESQSKVTKSPQEQAGLERVLKGKDTPLGPRWTEDEYELLIKLWNERKKIREIAVKFPTRSGHAVGSALGRLKNSGAIEPRWAQKKKKRLPKVGAEPEPAPMQPSVDKSADTPVRNAPQSTAEAPAKPDSEVVKLLEEIRDRLLPPSISFESYCPSCHERRTEGEEEKVWQVCPKCGCKLIVWNVEVSV